MYTTLDRLEVGARGGPQRTFRITEEGRGEVKDWVRSSAVDAVPARDDLIMKVLVVVGRGGNEALQVMDGQRAAFVGGAATRPQEAAIRRR